MTIYDYGLADMVLPYGFAGHQDTSKLIVSKKTTSRTHSPSNLGRIVTLGTPLPTKMHPTAGEMQGHQTRLYLKGFGRNELVSKDSACLAAPIQLNRSREDEPMIITGCQRRY